MTTVGVLALQGGVREHVRLVEGLGARTTLRGYRSPLQASRTARAVQGRTLAAGRPELTAEQLALLDEAPRSASVAAVTILGVQHYNANSLATGTHPTVLNTVPVGGVAAPVSINFQNPRQLTEHTAQPASNQVQQQAERERMAVFLRDHQLQQRLHQSEE